MASFLNQLRLHLSTCKEIPIIVWLTFAHKIRSPEVVAPGCSTVPLCQQCPQKLSVCSTILIMWLFLPYLLVHGYKKVFQSQIHILRKAQKTHAQKDSSSCLFKTLRQENISISKNPSYLTYISLSLRLDQKTTHSFKAAVKLVFLI